MCLIVTKKKKTVVTVRELLLFLLNPIELENLLVARAIITRTRWIETIATAKADRSMPEAIFRCQSRRESRGARMNATTSVDAQWVWLSFTATA